MQSLDLADLSSRPTAATAAPHRSPPRQLKIADDWLYKFNVSIFSPYSGGFQTPLLAAKPWISPNLPQTYLLSAAESYFPGFGST